MKGVLAVVAAMIAGSVQAQEPMPEGIDVVSISGCNMVSPDRYSPPPIECNFTNNSQTPVSSIQYAIRVSEAGRTIPWSDYGFAGSPPKTYEVAGGLEPGENISTWLPAFGPADERANLDAIIIEAVVLAAFDVNGDPIE